MNNEYTIIYAPCCCFECLEKGSVQPGHFMCESTSNYMMFLYDAGMVDIDYIDGVWVWVMTGESINGICGEHNTQQ